ncbi:MAG: hypothetical protein ACTHJX_10480 [Terriglobales bacterium]
MSLALLGCVAAAQQVSGGGGSGNATKLQGVPVSKTAPSNGTCLVYSSGTGNWQASSCAGTASTAWSALTSGTNTAAAMVVGTGASLATTGAGTIAATTVPAAGLGAGTIGNSTTGNAATATACASTNGCWPYQGAYGKPTSLDLGNATDLPFTALPALPWTCSAGLGDGLNAIAAGTYLQTTCYNGTGHTVTITGIKCYSDNSGSSTMSVSNGAGTGLLTGAITCTSSFASGTQSGTTTIASGDYFKFTFVADGTTKQTTWVIVGTY